MSVRRRLGGIVLGFGALALLEVLCRVWASPDPTVPTGTPAAETITLEGDPWLLWQLRPGDRVEHGKPVHVNAQGFRDRERTEKAGPRVMTLGDSSVYGFGVGDEEVFSSRLEAAIPGIEVVNGATPGWSTFQTRNMLDMRGWALDPDLLIVGNLWSDNNFDDFVDKDLLASYAGFGSSAGRRAREILSGSALFRRLDWELRVAPQGEQARKVGWTMGGEGPKSGHRRVAIQDYANNLDAMCVQMHARGGGVMFVILANREDVNPRSHDPAWGPYREVMRETAARYGAPILDFAASVRTSGRGQDYLFMDQMHPTAEGHALLAEEVKRTLEAEGWPAKALTLGEGGPVPAYVDRFFGRGNDPGGGR